MIVRDYYVSSPGTISPVRAKYNPKPILSKLLRKKLAPMSAKKPIDASGIAHLVLSVATLNFECIERPTPPPTIIIIINH